MLNLQRLAVFREVARSGSFSVAAERLDYSQPAISHHVAKLELEVGAALFVRMRRGLKLTDAGHEVLRHADALLDLAGDAEAELRAVVRETPECVRLGGFQTSTEAVMATALEAFWARFPQTRVTLLEADPIDHLESLRAGQLDLALVFDHPEGPIADDDRVVVRSVHEDPMVLVLPEGHALAAGRDVPLAALADARWLEGAGPEATSSVFLVRACESLGLTPEIAFACGNYYAVQGLVARGMGIALIPELATRHRVDGTVLRSPSDTRPTRRIGVARLRARNVAPHVAAMERAIAGAFERYAAARAAASITAS